MAGRTGEYIGLQSLFRADTARTFCRCYNRTRLTRYSRNQITLNQSRCINRTMLRVIIIAIGNELLIGETLDTNTNWLCRQLTGLGAHVERAVILPDQMDQICDEIKRWCEFGIDLLITTGGLGPTDDDLTLAAVAKALNLPLE